MKLDDEVDGDRLYGADVTTHHEEVDVLLENLERVTSSKR